MTHTSQFLDRVRIAGGPSSVSTGAEPELKRLFGEQQMRSLADLVQAALMLNYNGRTVG